MEETLEVVCQRPFEARFGDSAQAEAQETQRQFKDSEHGLDGLLALCVKLSLGVGR